MIIDTAAQAALATIEVARAAAEAEMIRMGYRRDRRGQWVKR
jgi:hypothetical protein